MIINNKNILICFFAIVLILGCKKYVDINAPRNELSSSLVFEDYESALSAVSGIYSQMEQGYGFMSGSAYSISWLCGLAADEYITKSGDPNYLVYQNNNIDPLNFRLKAGLWEEPYKIIYSCNAILEGLSNSNAILEERKRQLSGEARFIRAFAYFYLTNIFGNIPLATTTDYEINNSLSKSEADSIYQFIESELIDSKNLLNNDYTFSNNERVRVNKYAATAFLARVYLYQQKWEKAEIESSEVISATNLYNLEPEIDNIFLKNSSESIWQLMPANISAGANTSEAALLQVFPQYYVSLQDDINSIFEPADLRFEKWIEEFDTGSEQLPVLKKYKQSGLTPMTQEYYMVLRLSEQYLIRAEARANMENFTGCKEDLYVIRQRSNLGMPLGNDLSALQSSIEYERQVELIGEHGHRWFDLKRWKSVNDPQKTRADDILPLIKEDNWKATDVLFPIPSSEIIINPKLLQNPGYN